MTSSDEQKCLRCEFSAPVGEWKNFRDGRRNPLCPECSYMYCGVCKFVDGRVWQWRYEENGVSGFRCPKCNDPTLRKCGREWCGFWAPLKDWKIKADGVPGKWCERCCEVGRKRDKKVRDEKRESHMSNLEEDHKSKWNGKALVGGDECRKKYEEYCIKEGIDFVKADARRDKQHEVRMRSIRCPGCDKEMRVRSLKKQQDNHCKAVLVAPLVESAIAPVD
jgi:hypothetical protein